MRLPSGKVIREYLAARFPNEPEIEGQIMNAGNLHSQQFLGLEQVMQVCLCILRINEGMGIGIYGREIGGPFGIAHIHYSLRGKEHSVATIAGWHHAIKHINAALNGLRQYTTRHFGTFSATLTGDCQIHNTNTLLHAMDELIRLLPERAEHLRAAIPEAFLRVSELTHLRGRWEQVGAHPTIICDAGHNAGGWAYLGEQLQRAAAHHPTLHILFGMAEDKDIDAVLQKLPQKARYYFTQASVKRAMPDERLAEMAAHYGLHGETYPTVGAAKAAALAAAGRDDMIFVGGSCFVVADYLSEEA